MAPYTGPVIGAEQSQAATDFGIASLPTGVAGPPSLPAGFPSRVDSQLAWVGTDFADQDSYVYQLSEADLAELTDGIIHFKALGLDGECLSCDTFPLPVLGAKLRQMSNDVHNGRGFCLVRGIQPDKYTVEDLTLLYLGVQAYIANERGRQDNRGNMLVHIIADSSTKTRIEHHRHSNKSITFHTEETGDVVGWITRSTAANGGRCILASAHTVYNVLAERRPDLLRLLMRSDWPFALPRFQCRPIFFYRDSRLMMNFGRTPLLGTAIHPRPKNLPNVSARQVEALDAVETIARATELEIQTQAGDMHFINNLAVLHRREQFTDGVAKQEKRHLVRMRLRSSELGWPIPQELEDEWAKAFGAKGPKMWHLEPMPDAYFPLRKYAN